MQIIEKIKQKIDLLKLKSVEKRLNGKINSEEIKKAYKELKLGKIDSNTYKYIVEEIKLKEKNLSEDLELMRSKRLIEDKIIEYKKGNIGQEELIGLLAKIEKMSQKDYIEYCKEIKEIGKTPIKERIVINNIELLKNGKIKIEDMQECLSNLEETDKQICSKYLIQIKNILQQHSKKEEQDNNKKIIKKVIYAGVGVLSFVGILTLRQNKTIINSIKTQKQLECENEETTNKEINEYKMSIRKLAEKTIKTDIKTQKHVGIGSKAIIENTIYASSDLAAKSDIITKPTGTIKGEYEIKNIAIYSKNKQGETKKEDLKINLTTNLCELEKVYPDSKILIAVRDTQCTEKDNLATGWIEYNEKIKNNFIEDKQNDIEEEIR